MALKHCDIIIVGAGIAGSMLAYQLLQTGKSIQIIHDGNSLPASRVAAGIINPLAGQRFALHPHMEHVLSSMRETYAKLEARFHVSLLHTMPMRRSIKNEKEAAHWRKRSDDATYDAFWDKQHSSNEKGYITQTQTGYLDTNTLLDTLHGYFVSLGIMWDKPLNYGDVQLQKDGVQWQGLHARHMMFCEGWRGQENPWFSWLPFQAAKGEILSLTTTDTLPEYIINHGRWLLPVASHHCKLGASYDTSNIDERPTLQAKAMLMHALKDMPIALKDAQVIAHQAGVRAGVKDKQPLLGLHPQYPQLGIFNGLGSKASMLTPWYCKQWVEHLCHHQVLPSHCDIARFAEQYMVTESPCD